MEPRVVVVTRPTEYQGLLARHGTHGQAAWFLDGRGQDIATYAQRDERQRDAVVAVQRAIPEGWRRTRIERADLDRFLFEPGDVVVAVGQDGLVANVAKYLDGQPVVGVNPDPDRFEGTLVRHRVEAVPDLLRSTLRVEPRTMVEVRTDAGHTLIALNELFCGHRTHQSARYVLTAGGRSERQSSSGLIVATGTGATGWARSIHRCHRSELPLPAPSDPRVAFFVREPWPSVASGATLTEGLVGGDEAIQVRSEMNDGGTLFGDGIEADAVPFDYGVVAAIRPAARVLRLVV